MRAALARHARPAHPWPPQFAPLHLSHGPCAIVWHAPTPPHARGSAPRAAAGRHTLGPTVVSKADALAPHAARPPRRAAASREQLAAEGVARPARVGGSREPRGAVCVTRTGPAGRPAHQTAWDARAASRSGACAPLRRRASTRMCIVARRTAHLNSWRRAAAAEPRAPLDSPRQLACSQRVLWLALFHRCAKLRGLRIAWQSAAHRHDVWHQDEHLARV